MKRRQIPHPFSVAVVGAGIAGLAAARSLQDRGIAVQVFERASGVGGRTAHRRINGYEFDHGAQYFTARDPRFAALADNWRRSGVVAPWTVTIASLGERRERAATDTALVRYVGTPGMNAMAKHLASELNVTTRCTIARLLRDGRAWVLESDNGTQHGPYNALVLALPPPQAARLAAPCDLLAGANGQAFEPCWCAMVAFDSPLAIDVDAAFVNGDTLSWIARDSAKPGRRTGERWVIHANSRWSAARLASSRDAVARALLSAFFSTVNLAPRQPEILLGHRWSFARPPRADQPECVWHGELDVALCGDWCLGGRIESAYLSGFAAAERVASVAHACLSEHF